MKRANTSPRTHCEAGTSDAAVLKSDRDPAPGSLVHRGVARAGMRYVRAH